MADEVESELIVLQERKQRIPTLTLEDILNEKPELQEKLLAEVESDDFVMPAFLRYKGDLQAEAQFKAAEKAQEEREHHHH